MAVSEISLSLSAVATRLPLLCFSIRQNSSSILLYVSFFVAPLSSTVFYYAIAFNQDLSKWNTSAVTNMRNSKCILPSVVLWFLYMYNTTTRVSLEDKRSHMFCFFKFSSVYGQRFHTNIVRWSMASFVCTRYGQSFNIHRSFRLLPNRFLHVKSVRRFLRS